MGRYRGEHMADTSKERNWPRYVAGAITVFLTIGAFGHLGDELIAGITFIIAVVEAYEWILDPVIELVRQILPDGWPSPSAYVFDFVVLMNVAVRILVWSQRVPVLFQLYQVSIVSISVFALSYSFDWSSSLFVAGLLGFAGVYLLFGSMAVVAWWRVNAAENPTIKKFVAGDRMIIGGREILDVVAMYESLKTRTIAWLRILKQPWGSYRILANARNAGFQWIAVVAVVGAVMLSGFAVKQINEHADPSLDVACRMALATEEWKAELLASAGVAYTVETPGACFRREV